MIGHIVAGLVPGLKDQTRPSLEAHLALTEASIRDEERRRPADAPVRQDVEAVSR
jgi:hypothetical protein